MTRPIRVTLDVAALARRRMTGWERFVSQLADALVRVGAPDVDVVQARPRATAERRLENLLRQLAWLSVGLPGQSAHTQVLHYPTYPPVRTPTRTIWTVHDDLILGGHPEHARTGAAIWVPLARRALRHIDAVAATTCSVAADLLAIGVEAERIVVIPPGVPSMAAPSLTPPRLTSVTGDDRVLPSEFALAVGTVEGRKRPETAAAAAAAAGLPLVLAGGVDPSLDLGRLPPGTVLLTGRITDAELSHLYARACVLISASAYEGLDFPVVEALSLGLPVAASDIPVHRELGGAEIELFPLDDVERAVAAMEGAMRRDRIPHAALPSWDDCARSYLNLYRLVARGP